MKLAKTTLIVVAATALMAGCAKPTTEYGDSRAVETVTNEFGSTDLQMIAEDMTRSLLVHPVIANGNRPRVTISPVRNKTSEYIDTKSITDSIRAQLVKSGRARFVVDINEMSGQKAELDRQTDELYDQNKAKKKGKMLGADFRIDGEITSIVKQTKDVKDVFYKMSLQLVNIETGDIEWADEKEIRKTTKKR